MKNIIYIFLFICITLTNCNKGPKQNEEQKEIEVETLNPHIKSAESDFEAVAAVSETEEAIMVKELILKNDDSINENTKIVFIDKANFGVLGGDNWIVVLSNKYGYHDADIYIMDNNVIVNKYYGTFIEHYYGEKNFEPMENIPGKQLGNSFNFYGDFNGDDIDELFYLDFGLLNLLQIYGFDETKDKFIDLLNVSFEYKYIQRIPTIKYMTFNNVSGFVVLYISYYEGGDPNPIIDPYIGKWLFFTWNNEQRKYVRIGEVINDFSELILHY
jgi:hypothetical protein